MAMLCVPNKLGCKRSAGRPIRKSANSHRGQSLRGRKFWQIDILIKEESFLREEKRILDLPHRWWMVYCQQRQVKIKSHTHPTDIMFVTPYL